MNSILKTICAYFPQISNYFLLNKFPIFLLLFISNLSLTSTATYNNCSSNIGPQICVFGQHFWPIAAAAVAAALLATRNWQRAVGAIGNWQPVYAAQIIANRLTASWVESLFLLFANQVQNCNLIRDLSQHLHMTDHEEENEEEMKKQSRKIMTRQKA